MQCSMASRQVQAQATTMTPTRTCCSHTAARRVQHGTCHHQYISTCMHTRTHTVQCRNGHAWQGATSTGAPPPHTLNLPCIWDDADPPASAVHTHTCTRTRQQKQWRHRNCTPCVGCCSSKPTGGTCMAPVAAAVGSARAWHGVCAHVGACKPHRLATNQTCTTADRISHRGHGAGGDGCN